MKKILAKIAFALGKSPIGLIPVRVRKGLAKGSRWTLLPSSAYWRGTFESDIDAAISRLNLKPGMCCWDLGTHFGIYTVGLAKIVGEKGEVIGFEPDPFSYSRCVRHIKMNNLSWAKIFEGAASDVSDYSEILVYGKLGVTTTHLAYPGETGVGAERVKVATFAIDDLVEKSSIRLPNFVKVDVEGHGAKALFGMKKSLLKARPHVIFSVHCPEEARAIREYFQSYVCRNCITHEIVDWPEENWFGEVYLDPGSADATENGSGV